MQYNLQLADSLGRDYNEKLKKLSLRLIGFSIQIQLHSNSQSIS